MTAIFSLSKWFEIIERGTSGDQVSDILFSWEKDRIALTNRITELEEETKGTYCAYCGTVFAIDDTAAALVSDHIRTCEKHPMRDIEKAYEKLRLDYNANLASTKKIISLYEGEITANQELRGQLAQAREDRELAERVMRAALAWMQTSDGDTVDWVHVQNLLKSALRI